MSDLPISTSDVKQIVKIRKSESGFGSQTPQTVVEVLKETVAKHGNKPALYQKIIKSGAKADKTTYSVWTWKEYSDKIDASGKSLMSLGLEPFDIINIIGFNSREWFTANFGAIAAGGVAAGIYATNQPDACQYISEHSEAKVVVCDGLKQLDKFLEIHSELPNLKALVMYGPDELTEKKKSGFDIHIYTFDEFLELGKDVPDDDLKKRKDAQQPGQTCTLIYTSGTTGPPKAVMISHDNITWTVKAMLSVTPRRKMDDTDSMISYLPLSHIAAQMLDLHQPMMTGSKIYFAQPDALKGSLGDTLREVRPTIFFGVPRVWEKIYDKMQQVAKSTTGVKKAMSTWAKKQALQHWESKEFGSSTKSPAMYFLAKKLLRKAHVALGLDRCQCCYVSAAPIEVKILRYFASIDMPIMELFGQSECTGPHASNKLTAFKLGTVGRPLPGTETKSDPETGELCYRGRNIFVGYMKMPEKTNETIDTDGWLHSGDIVSIDNDHDPSLPKPSGFISITGRIKELIITAGGENVPPVLIEDQFKLAMPALSNCMVIGDKRKFLSILFCLHVEIDDEGVASNRLTGQALETSEQIGSSAKTTEEARDCPKWKDYFEKGMKEANSKATSRAQNVAKYSLLSTDFTEKGGELTPTLKLKRSVAADIHGEAIEAMYA